MSSSMLDILCCWNPQQSRHRYQMDETGRIRIIRDSSSSITRSRRADATLLEKQNEGVEVALKRCVTGVRVRGAATVAAPGGQKKVP